MVCAGGLIFIPFQFIYCLQGNIFLKILRYPTVFQMKALSNSLIIMSVLHWEFRIFGCWTIRTAKYKMMKCYSLTNILQSIQNINNIPIGIILLNYVTKLPYCPACQKYHTLQLGIMKEEIEWPHASRLWKRIRFKIWFVSENFRVFESSNFVVHFLPQLLPATHKIKHIKLLFFR